MEIKLKLRLEDLFVSKDKLAILIFRNNSELDFSKDFFLSWLLQNTSFIYL